MNSPIKLPEGTHFSDADPSGPWFDADDMRAYAKQAVREALAEYVPVACCLATSQDVLHEFSPMRDAERVARMARKLRQKLVHLYVIPENNHTPTECGACSGTGRVVRDPDIGTDQECWVCDGSGRHE